MESKIFGVFPHRVLDPRNRVLSGFDEVFPAPHSRHTETRAADIEATDDLELLAVSAEAGGYLVGSRDGRELYVTGHPEYERHTLKLEYDRDHARGLDVAVPRHYYPADDPAAEPMVTWRSHAYLLYANWLNYCVYQATPFDLDAIGTS